MYFPKGREALVPKAFPFFISMVNSVVPLRKKDFL